MDCPSLAKCPFFNDRMQKLPGITELYKKNYCKGDYNKCARWQVAQATGSVPPLDLFPNQLDRVNELINSGS